MDIERIWSVWANTAQSIWQSEPSRSVVLHREALKAAAASDACLSIFAEHQADAAQKGHLARPRAALIGALNKSCALAIEMMVQDKMSCSDLYAAVISLHHLTQHMMAFNGKMGNDRSFLQRGAVQQLTRLTTQMANRCLQGATSAGPSALSEQETAVLRAVKQSHQAMHVDLAQRAPEAWWRMSGRPKAQPRQPSSLKLKSEPRETTVTVVPVPEPQTSTRFAAKIKRFDAMMSPQDKDQRRHRLHFCGLNTGFCPPVVMTSTLFYGGFGKMHYAYAADGTALIVKEVRHIPKPGVNRMGKVKTHPMTRSQVALEVGNQERLRLIVDNAMRPFDQLPVSNKDSLLKVRRGTQPLLIHDVIYDTDYDRTFIVMNRMTADAHVLHHVLGAVGRRAAPRSFAAQIFSELGFVNDLGRHFMGDIKLGNVVFNGLGQMLLIDFGVSDTLDAAQVTGSTCLASSIPAPEALVPFTDTQYLVPFGAPADVFAAAVCVAEMAQDPADPVLPVFHFNFLLPGYCEGQEVESHRYKFELFASWKTMVAGADGRVCVDCVAHSAPGFFDDYFRPLAKGNPALCDLILNQALQADPALRPPAATLGAAARALCQPNDDDMLVLLQTMAECAMRQQTEPLLQAAQAFASLEQQIRVP